MATPQQSKAFDESALRLGRLVFQREKLNQFIGETVTKIEDIEFGGAETTMIANPQMDGLWKLPYTEHKRLLEAKNVEVAKQIDELVKHMKAKWINADPLNENWNADPSTKI